MKHIFFNKRTVIATVLALMATAWSTQSSAQTPTTLGVGISTPVGTLHVHSNEGITPPVPSDPILRSDEDVFAYDYNTVFHITNTNTGATAADGFSISQYNYDNREVCCCLSESDIK